MAIGLYHRSISMLDLLLLQSFSFLTPLLTNAPTQSHTQIGNL